MKPCMDRSVGEWWLRSLRSFHDYRVGSVVPSGFESITRLMHPVHQCDEREFRWSEVAAATGRVVHSGMQLHTISAPLGTSPDWRERHGYRSWEGDLPLAEAITLASALTTFTAESARCYFGIWEGYGGLTLPSLPDEPLLAIPNRHHYLLSGCLNDLLDKHGEIRGWLGHVSPNLWWPEDRSWCVVSEIDFAWTYVAGPAHLAHALETNEALETYAVGYGDNHTFAGDHLNT